MPPLKTSTVTEQVASHLREEIQTGRWKEEMPGRRQLAEELGSSPCSIQRALEILEREGLLIPQGGGKKRKIALKPHQLEARVTRVGILLFDPPNAKQAFVVDLKHQLIESGHKVRVLPQTLTDLRMDVTRVAQQVRKYEVDAWIVIAAPHSVLEWFAEQPVPVFAFCGYHHELAIAATSKNSRAATQTAVERLISLGHRRIVFLIRAHLKNPPCPALQVFMKVLEAHNIPIGRYNMPDWEENAIGLQRCLNSLFATTPPTAFIIDEPELFLAAQQHLASAGLLAPSDVSLICTDPSRSFEWSNPSVAHNSWDLEVMVRRAVRWVNNISHGKSDRRKTTVKAVYIDGGTVGPAPGGDFSFR